MTVRSPMGLTLGLVLAVGCGGDDPPAPEETSTPPAAATPPSSDAATATPAETRTPPPTEQPAASPETVLASSMGARVYTIQVGAYQRQGNAARMIRRLEGAGFPAWEVAASVGGASYTRVRVGATADRVQANRMGTLVRDRLGLDHWVAPVAPDMRVPGAVVDGTRSLLGG